MFITLSPFCIHLFINFFISCFGFQVKEQNADILVFQEVRHDAKRDSQPQSLARMLPPGLQFVFQPAMEYVAITEGRHESSSGRTLTPCIFLFSLPLKISRAVGHARGGGLRGLLALPDRDA